MAVTLVRDVRIPATRWGQRSALFATLIALIGALIAVVTPPAFASGNDYPYATTNPSVTPSDPWGFGIRQCTSFVAWRLHQHNVALTNYGFRGPDGQSAVWGNASNWDAAAHTDGYGVGTTAVVGAVAQWHANESSPFYSAGSSVVDGRATAGAEGHVAWVMQVYSDGSALVEQYNGNGGDLAYSTMRVKAPRYLYIAVPVPVPTVATSANASVGLVLSGGAAGIYAHVYDPAAHNATLPGRAVQLYQKVAFAGSYRLLASSTTLTGGVREFIVHPYASTYYVACSGGACSKPVPVSVYGAVRAGLAAVRYGSAYISGSVHPAAGERVYLQAPYAGHWVNYRVLATSRTGTFTFVVAASRAVPYRVWLPASAASTSALSGVVRVP